VCSTNGVCSAGACQCNGTANSTCLSPCATSPCINGGTCTSSGCLCPAGYNGTTCQNFQGITGPLFSNIYTAKDAWVDYNQDSSVSSGWQDYDYSIQYYYTLLEFDLTSIVSNPSYCISDVVLYLSCWMGQIDSYQFQSIVNVNFNLTFVNSSSWNESTIAWNNVNVPLASAYASQIVTILEAPLPTAQYEGEAAGNEYVGAVEYGYALLNMNTVLTAITSYNNKVSFIINPVIPNNYLFMSSRSSKGSKSYASVIYNVCSPNAICNLATQTC
jgi:hypothetical protein